MMPLLAMPLEYLWRNDYDCQPADVLRSGSLFILALQSAFQGTRKSINPIAWRSDITTYELVVFYLERYSIAKQLHVP